MRYPTIIMCAIASIAAGEARAADFTDYGYNPGSFYFGGRLGWNNPISSMHEMDVDTYSLSFDDKLYGGVYAGTLLGGGFRGELALDYLRFDAVRANDEPPQDDPVSGGTDALALTASLWRDLPQIGPATPYVGMGAGLAWTSMDLTLDFDTPQVFGSDDLSAVGLVGAGLRFDVGHRMNLDIGYRFHSIISARNEQLLPDDGNLDYGVGHYTSHMAFLGLSYWFGDSVPASAHAPAYPWYIGGYVGQAWTPDTHIAADHGEIDYTVFDNPQLNFGLVAGTDIALGLRGELELGRVRSEAASLAGGDRPYDGRFDQTFALVNAWQDFGNSPLRPYVGGGLGLAIVDYDIDDYNGSRRYDGTSHVFAGQFGAGLRYDVGSTLTVDLGYRMKGAIGALFIDSETDTEENARGTLYSHNVQLGATYTFGDDSQVPETTNHDAYWSAGLGIGIGMVGELIEDKSHPVYFDTPLSGSLAYGHNITPKIRGEIELSYLHANADKTRDDNPDDPFEPVDGYVAQISVMSNFWADLDLGPLQPYVGGGVGLAMVKPQFGYDGEEYHDGFNPALALQAGFGLRHEMTDRFAVDVGYRYRVAIDAFSADTSGISDPSTTTYEWHSIQASLVWKTAE